MNKEYYEDYYRFEREHWWFIVRSKIIRQSLIRKINPSVPLKILNVGVATGATTEMLMQFGEVTSVEYDVDCCEFVSNVLKTKVYNNSITELPFENNSFDLVCAFDVIEHVAEHEAAVREMDRVCKKGGFLYVTVPAFMSLWSKHDVINHHERRYRLPQLRDLFTKQLEGKTIYSSYFNSFLFIPIFIFRKLTSVFQKEKKEEEIKSDFETINSKSFFGKITNGILGFIFSIERQVLKLVRFPAGISIIFIWKKQ